MEPQDAIDNYRRRISESGVFGALDALDHTVRGCLEPAGSMSIVLPRIPVFTAQARSVLGDADPFRVSFVRLGNLVARLTNLQAYAVAATAGEDRAHDIDTDLDAALDDLAAIAAAAGADGGSDGVAAVEAMREIFIRSEATLLAQTTTLSARLTEMTAQEATLASRHAELQSLIDQAAADVAAARAAAVADVEQSRTANSAALTEFRSAFDSATADSVAAGKAQIKAMLDTAAAEQAAQALATQADLEAQRATANASLNLIRTTEADVMKLARALGTGAQSAGWGSYADQQRKAANRLLGGAVVGFLAAAGFAASLAILAADADVELTWQRIATKLGVTAALGVVGAYLAAQSGEHRHQERLARRRHLDLLALPVFIAELNDTDRHIILQKLAEGAFLTPDVTPPPRGPRRGVTAGQAAEIADAVGRALK